MISATLLDCRNLAFERDDVPVFEALSFTAGAGELVQILGPNGAGKTTLLRIIVGALTPSAGELLWRGHPLRFQRHACLNDILYLGHHPGIKHGLTPRENLHWLFQLHPNGGGNIDQVLALVGLKGYEDVPASTLSAGQLRRVALARLYLSRASLWVLDEPFTSIDKAGVKSLETLMSAHLERGGAVILATHQSLSLPQVKWVDLESYAVA